MLSLTLLFAISLCYLIILFGSAYATDRGWIPQRISAHPLVRVLALGVFAGSLALFGTLEAARMYGGSYLTYYLGTSAGFIASSFLCRPLYRVATAHKLGSLADLFAFRYPAPWVGGLVAAFMLVGVLPLMALQVQVVSVTMHALNQSLSEDIFSAAYCGTMMLFAILFGAKHLSTKNKHQGLVVAIGIESVIKLVAFGLVAAAAIYTAFGGFSEMFAWAGQHASRLALAEDQLSTSAVRALLLTYFAATVTLPHVYHILVTENDDDKALRTTRWGFPTYLLCLSLCVPPIVWAAVKLSVPDMPTLYPVALGQASGNNTFVIIAFVAGLAASSGMLVVTTLALAAMAMNHLLLPLGSRLGKLVPRATLFAMRRLLIAAIILAAYLVHTLFTVDQGIVTIGFIAVLAVAQFLPGLVATFHWRHANRMGLLAGILSGFLVWGLAYLPLPFELTFRELLSADGGAWTTVAWASLLANTTMLVLVSLVTKQSPEEQLAAIECSSKDLPVLPSQPQAKSVPEIQSSLASAIGIHDSMQQVNLALKELRYQENEVRPFALAQLRDKMEMNLSSSFGPTVARDIMRQVLPARTGKSTDRIHALESHLEDYRLQLTGLAQKLDKLRRLHRQTLQDLPIAACTIDASMMICSWNGAMEALTQIPADSVVDQRLAELPEPWCNLFTTLVNGKATKLLRYQLNIQHKELYLNLHKASVMDGEPDDRLVVAIEDMTETKQLEFQLMHKERLASIGQLVTGIAHEIGNPVTNVACLAQEIHRDQDQKPLWETATQVLVQTERISSILKSLMTFAHGSPVTGDASLVPLNLHQCVDEAIMLVSFENKKGITFCNDCSPHLAVLGNAQKLSQVFVNILSNAIDASELGGTVRIASELPEDQQQDAAQVQVLIADEGHGIPENSLDEIFDPFYTTKPPGLGAGLGLAIVTSIMVEHQGKVSIRSNSSKGTTFVVSLPAVQQAAN